MDWIIHKEREKNSSYQRTYTYLKMKREGKDHFLDIQWKILMEYETRKFINIEKQLSTTTTTTKTDFFFKDIIGKTRLKKTTS